MMENFFSFFGQILIGIQLECDFKVICLSFFFGCNKVVFSLKFLFVLRILNIEFLF